MVYVILSKNMRFTLASRRSGDWRQWLVAEAIALDQSINIGSELFLRSIVAASMLRASIDYCTLIMTFLLAAEKFVGNFSRLPG